MTTVFYYDKCKTCSPNNQCTPVSSASCMDNPDSEMVFYLMLRAVDRFYQQHSRYPGTSIFFLPAIFFFKFCNVVVCDMLPQSFCTHFISYSHHILWTSCTSEYSACSYFQYPLFTTQLNPKINWIDNHIKFLLTKGKSIYFIHSSFSTHFLTIHLSAADWGWTIYRRLWPNSDLKER